jgi:dipeptidyl aminopeptidase/acylaminoacyl peptidase
MNRRLAVAVAFAISLLNVGSGAIAQGTTAGTPPQGTGRGGGQRRDGIPWRTADDTARAHRLYISIHPEDLPKTNPRTEARVRTDSIFAARSAGVMDFQRITYKSDVDGLEIPGYVFAPLKKRGAKGHAAMVWVHGFVHGNFDEYFLPFVIEAVQRGYVIVAPNYRGSLGYTGEFADRIDYGGKEIDDAESAYTFIRSSLPYVDPDRVGIMGWSHGGFITAHILFRDNQPFKAGAPLVPVTNLIFRLGTHSPSYTQPFASNPDIGGMPSDRTCGPKHDESCVPYYVKRSPVFQAGNLKVPILVHAATNDCDVDFIEDQQMIYTLMALKPQLADTKIYVDPPVGWEGCGHTFSQRIVTDPKSPKYLERDDSPEQIDAWNRIWAFFGRNLHPER